jgi:hypothetical protein
MANVHLDQEVGKRVHIGHIERTFGWSFSRMGPTAFDRIIRDGHRDPVTNDPDVRSHWYAPADDQVEAMCRQARRSSLRTGRPEVVHRHAADERCTEACVEVDATDAG